MGFGFAVHAFPFVPVANDFVLRCAWDFDSFGPLQNFTKSLEQPAVLIEQAISSPTRLTRFLF
jgi:hypothetical protein